MTYTAGDIPIWGITSLMTESEKDRASILSLARIVAGIAGALTLLTIVPISQSVGASFTAGGMTQSKGLQWGFIAVCGIFTVVGSLMFQCAAFAKERVEQPSDEHKGFIENVKKKEEEIKNNAELKRALDSIGFSNGGEQSEQTE